MSAFNLSELSNRLNNYRGSGVSFAKKSLKLDTEEDAAELIQAIKACPCLEYLDLEGNTLGPIAAKAVAQILKTNGRSLKRALWKDMFTGRLKTEIPKSLEYLGGALCSAGTSLVELDLSDNAFGPIGVEGLASFLTSKTCYTLRELRLNNNGLGISGGKILAKALLNCHENSSKAGSQPLMLKVFVAGRNRLENEGAQALAAVFKKLTSLEEVAMPQNSIYHMGIAAIANGLSANPGLRVLNLNDNTVGIKGAEALAKALPNFRNLEQLNLGDCLLRTNGALILAEALGIEGNHPALTDLNLSFNEIHTRGASAIAQAVADKKLLMHLQLDGNNFGSEGRAILRSSLESSEKIDSLGTLSDDETEDEEEEEVEDESQSENESDESEDKQPAMPRDNNRPSCISIAEFLKCPSAEKLLLLPDENAQAFIEYAKESIEIADVSLEQKFAEEFTKIIMKVSALCDSGYSQVRIRAENLTDSLYAELFNFAKNNDQISNLNNALILNLGLIKSEDKHSGKIDWNLAGCFKALEKISQKEYFLMQTRETLKLFLDKPAKIKAKEIDPFLDSKMALRAVLENVSSP